MAVPMLTAAPTDRPGAGRGGVWFGAPAASAALHGAVLAALLGVAVSLPREPDAPRSFEIVFAPPAAPVEVTRFTPLPVLAARQVVRALREVAPLHLPAAVPVERIARAVPVGREARLTTAKVQPPVEAAPALPAASDVSHDIAQLTQRIDVAVQQAAAMPEAARRMRREGRARVSFDYRDGGVDAVALAAPSGFGLFDEAAVKAVYRARYPSPPTELEGRTLRLLVWVDFRVVSTD